MNEKEDTVTRSTSAGLCADCAHARQIESKRGSLFILCNLSRTDPRFAKYPRLPILACDGYNRKEAELSSPLPF